MINRRGLLTRIVQGFTITGAGFLAYPFIKAWIPKFDNDLSLDVAIDDLLPGQSKIVHWLGRNLFIHRRSQEELVLLNSASDAAPDTSPNTSLYKRGENLKDPNSIESTQPDFALNQYRSLRPEIFVVYNNCTHLGCEVIRDAGFFKCPCHQSDFDGAGRVVEESAAPINLEVPDYQYISGNRIRLIQAT